MQNRKPGALKHYNSLYKLGLVTAQINVLTALLN